MDISVSNLYGHACNIKNIAESGDIDKGNLRGAYFKGLISGLLVAEKITIEEFKAIASGLPQYMQEKEWTM